MKMADQDLERIEKLVMAEWVSPLRELDKIIDRDKKDEKTMTAILGMADRIGRKHLGAAISILQKLIQAGSGTSLEMKAVSQWQRTVEKYAEKDVFKALSQAGASAAACDPALPLKKSAIGTWKYLFDRAAAQNPERALDSAAWTLSLTGVFRAVEAFGPASTQEFEDVVRQARDMLEIRTLLRQAAPKPR